VQESLLLNQREEIRSKLASLDRQIAQNEGNRAAVAATVNKLTLAIPLLQQRVDARKSLLDKEYAQRLQYLQEAQDLVEHQQELQVQKARLAEAEGALASLREQRLQAGAEYRRTNLADLSQAEQKSASLQEELVKAEEHRQLQTLTAPVDGTVQQLAVHTVGGVVTPAQPLLMIVPADSHLEIEAMVSNRDIGFIHAGEPAQIKIDTFNFTKYGLLHGEVLSLSQDAIVRDKPQDNSQSTTKTQVAQSDSSEPKGQELVYAARVSLDRMQMQVEDKLVSLTPGMAVTVEIKTGSRRVIEYVLSPILRYKQESLRER
jgi:hemolysin D